MIPLDNIPSGGGVYLLKQGSAIVYIGSTGNFAQRIPGHKKKKFDRVEFVAFNGCPKELEKKLIFKHRPRYNVQICKPGCGIALNVNESKSDRIRKLQADCSSRSGRRIAVISAHPWPEA